MKKYDRKIRAIDSAEFPISLSLSLSLSLSVEGACGVLVAMELKFRGTYYVEYASERVESRVNHRRRRIRQTRVRVVVSLSTYSSSRSLLLVSFPSSGALPFFVFLNACQRITRWICVHALHRERSNSHCLAADVA